MCCLNYAIFNAVFFIQYSSVSTLHCQAYFTFNNYIFLLVTEGNPTAGQSVDDTGILSCVQTFGLHVTVCCYWSGYINIHYHFIMYMCSK